MIFARLKWAPCVLLCVWACGGDDGSADAASAGSGNVANADNVTLTGDTACERYTSLAEALGCASPDCNTAAGSPSVATCEAHAIEWINCAATDRAQCQCEGDGDLNCEGSFKQDEGPARCSAEFAALEMCQP